MTFDAFVAQVRGQLEKTAEEKGYNQTGADGPNQLAAFVQSFAGDGHALGEIVYKVRRFAAIGNSLDLGKIAAWAFLVWRSHQPGGGR